MTATQRREPLSYSLSKHSHSGNVETAGKMHGSAVVTDKDSAALQKRNHLPQIHLCADRSRNIAQIISVTAWIHKRQNPNTRPCGKSGCDGAKSLERPSFGGGAGPGVNADDGVRHRYSAVH